jgi:hypothetical protein
MLERTRGFGKASGLYAFTTVRSRSSNPASVADALVEKQSADDCVRTASPRNVDLHMPLHVPVEIDTGCKVRNRLCTQHHIATRIHNLNCLRPRYPSITIPIQGIQRNPMGLAIGDVQIEIESGSAIPARCCAARARLERPEVTRAEDPRVARRILNRQRCIGRNRYRIIGDNIAASSVFPYPRTFGHRIRVYERSGA